MNAIPRLGSVAPAPEAGLLSIAESNMCTVDPFLPILDKLIECAKHAKETGREGDGKKRARMTFMGRAVGGTYSSVPPPLYQLLHLEREGT